MFQWLRSKYESLFVRKVPLEELMNHPNFGVTTSAKPKRISQDELEKIRNDVSQVELALKNGRTCPTCGKEGFDGMIHVQEYT